MEDIAHLPHSHSEGLWCTLSHSQSYSQSCSQNSSQQNFSTSQNFQNLQQQQTTNLLQPPPPPLLPSSLSSFFTIAKQLIDALSLIHQFGFIHNAIRPQNIVIDWKRLVVRIIDFGRASELRSNRFHDFSHHFLTMMTMMTMMTTTTMTNGHRLNNGKNNNKAFSKNVNGSGSGGGTGGSKRERRKRVDIHLREMRYISPEQTGRMNRSVTHTSDIYSLGIIFYELLGGVLPFGGSEQQQQQQSMMTKRGEEEEEEDNGKRGENEKDGSDESDVSDDGGDSDGGDEGNVGSKSHSHSEKGEKVEKSGGNDIVQLVYSIITSKPAHLNEFRPDVPRALADMIMHMIEKDPDERYQSMCGVKADFYSCLEMFSRNELMVDTRIDIGAHDVPTTFFIKQKLYGRSKEVQKLIQIHEQVQQNHIGSRLILVSGPSGSGKSRLINELQKPMSKPHSGFFITGKFDQIKKSMMKPYASFIEAFQQLTLVLLSESTDTIDHWRAKLISTLGSRAQVIIDMIPDIEKLIGPQQPAPKLPPAENETRFRQVLLDFIRVFAQENHSLVLCFDDLQWADVNSVNLIQMLISDPLTNNLIIIGTFRSNECDGQLQSMIHSLKQSSCSSKIEEIELKPLSIESVTEMLCDSLACSDSRKVRKLAEIAHKKTGGNPFFLRSYLISLAEENLLYHNNYNMTWEWNMEAILTTGTTDNILDLLFDRIKKLPIETQRCLSTASAIGDRFNVSFLARMCNVTEVETINVLWPAIKDDLLMQRSGEDCESLIGSNISWRLEDSSLSLSDISFVYTHDRIQQAAYETLSVEERELVHLKIGQTLLMKENNNLTSDDRFQIITHFKKTKIEYLSEEEKLKIAKICLDAGRMARISTAYPVASNYLKFGIRLLPSSDCWRSHYTLTMHLYAERTQIYFLTAKNEKGDQLYSLLLEKVTTDIDRHFVHMIMINSLELQQRYNDMMTLIGQCLRVYGIDIPSETEEMEKMRMEQIGLVNKNLNGRPIEALLDSPEMTNEKDLIIMELLQSFWVPSYVTGRSLLSSLMSILGTNYSIQKGNCQDSPIIYMSYSMFSGDLTGDYNHAYRFGNMALRLLDRYGSVITRARCYLIFGTSANNYGQHIGRSLYYFKKGWEYAIEGGDIAFSCYTSGRLVINSFYANEHFSTVRKLFLEHAPYIRKINGFIYGYVQCLTLGYRYLAGIRDDDENIGFNEEQFSQDDTSKLPMFQTLYSIGRLQRAIYRHDDVDLLPLAEFVHDVASVNLRGTFSAILGSFYSSLVFLNECGKDGRCYNDSERRSTLLLKVDQYIDKLTIWASGCEANFEHKLLILKAERARVLGQFETAVKTYNAAIASAHKHDFILYEALANELAAKFWTTSEIDMYASQHIKNAHYLYHRIGATQKVKQMQIDYPELTILVSDDDESTGSSTDEDETKMEAAHIDDISVYKGFQTMINTDMQLGDILNQTIRIIIENSGASRALFLLAEEENKLLVVAEGTSDQEIDSMRAIPLESYLNCPKMIFYHIERSHETVVISNCTVHHNFSADNYLAANDSLKSLIALPIMRCDEFKGILYLESYTLRHVFSAQRFKVILPLASQIVVLLENDKFSSVLESEKRYRTLAVELNARKKRLEEFIDVLCHELRNPLHGIFGSAEVLSDSLSQLGLDQNTQQYSRIEDSMEAITVSAGHLKDIVDCVLNISMLENQTIQLKSIVFDPAQTFHKILQIFKGQTITKGIALVSKVETQGLLVKGDPYRFKEIIINLVSNAIKFTTVGTITVTCVCCETDNDPSQLSIVVSVSDTGIGMTLAEQQTLFKPFSQATSETFKNYGGSGLGLKISKDLIEMMGGTIGVESEKDVGTTFTFKVMLRRPLEQEAKRFYDMENNEAEAATSQPSANENQPEDDMQSSSPQSNTMEQQQQQQTMNQDKKSKFILVAEDNSINQKLLTRILESDGYQFMVANNGLEAYNTYCNHHSDISLVLMDIEMPVCSGPESTRRIRLFEDEGSVVHVPIVAVSANSRRDYIDKMIQSHEFSDYITKPYLKQDLLDCVHRWTNV